MSNWQEQQKRVATGVTDGSKSSQPDNTAKLYEELRSIIDGGSESFTHEDAVQYLKDKLAQPEQEPVAWGVDWGKDGQQSCVSIVKRKPNGGIEVVAIEYNPTPSPQRKPLTDDEFLAQPEQIAVCIGYWNQKTGAYYKPDQISASHQKLIEDGILRRCYTTPPQRTWVGLEPEEIRKTNHHMVDGAYHYSFKQGAEWAEAKLKEKNT